MTDGHETVNVLPDLADAPNSYSGQGGKIVAVKAEEDGVEFIEPSGGASFTVSGAEVFSDTSPTTATALDLSGVVGANRAHVWLRFEATTDMNAVAIWADGDVSHYDAAVEANAYGSQLGHHDSTCPMVLNCVTSSLGVIQWQTETAATATVTLVDYIK